jgi:hypothetical protein
VAGSDWRFCIPYNETTKHLCGTSIPYIDPAEAPAFEFGDVVEDLRTGKTGIFSRKDADGVEVLLKKNITTVSRGIREIRLVRKGNFND